MFWNYKKTNSKIRLFSNVPSISLKLIPTHADVSSLLERVKNHVSRILKFMATHGGVSHLWRGLEGICMSLSTQGQRTHED